MKISQNTQTQTLLSLFKWFGNLVTMNWWTDLWLNEGLATHVENVAKDKVDPALQGVDRSVIEEMYEAFAVDALPSTTG